MHYMRDELSIMREGTLRFSKVKIKMIKILVKHIDHCGEKALYWKYKLNMRNGF